MDNLKFRFAKRKDVPLLSVMNKQLISDERHRHPMTVTQLEQRMSKFLQTEYTAVVISIDKNPVGYALYRRDPDWIYLRQLFIKREMRRKDVGRRAITWLKENPWKEAKRVRVEVLINNIESILFWRAMGFKDYCITMETDVPSRS